ncbi:HlyD family secretion protein [Rubellicoccus peritrichatus]|uniref:HlyD family efflux transporter periplasmic adaptor subunit n=1 Tax=Rubellicoccus peritrichatus TaxID=3080537 RepID=A0AAQ3LEP8_9BACT|nr:HlyD family efflux transporter periplasmic adaptor subunit [Puniceicoccus sp. CR14]WOO43342.1 HlyD family efflux transporter periplasmic adaptor subunit [Puniceicoccus sp. CR14]
MATNSRPIPGVVCESPNFALVFLNFLMENRKLHHIPKSSEEYTKSSTINKIVGLLGFILLGAGLALLQTEFEIEVFGTVSREDDYSVLAPDGGIVESVHIKEGDAVEAGQVIIKLDPVPLDLSILAKQRELAAMESQLRINDLAAREFTVKPGSVELIVSQEKHELLGKISEIQKDLIHRLEQLERNKDITTVELQEERIKQLRLELERLETEVRADWLAGGAQDLDLERLQLDKQRLQSGVDLLKKEIALLEKQRSRLTIRSPISGTITRLDFRYSGLIAQKGDLLFDVTDPNSAYIVELLVPERNVDLIKPGVPARMESEVFDSTIEGYITGTVQTISMDSEPHGASSKGPALFEVEVLVDETPLPLVLGSRLKTSIILGQRSIWEVFFQPRGASSSNRQSEGEAVL